MNELLQDPTFWFAVSFVIFVVIAWPLARKPVAGVFDSYAQKVRAELDEASRLRREAEALLREAQSRQNAAQNDAENILRHATTQAAALRVQADMDMQAALKRREAQTAERIYLLEEQAKSEIRSYAASRALKAAESLLRDHFSEAQDQALIDQQIKHIARP
ncbi:MAG TPA: F0F1 ATP synthase subunit B [Alphaproteobacteria bacterium]|nr:F0F1 ATP synthase subunit B [Alphaproteobacteria bacterium]